MFKPWTQNIYLIAAVNIDVMLLQKRASVLSFNKTFNPKPNFFGSFDFRFLSTFNTHTHTHALYLLYVQSTLHILDISNAFLVRSVHLISDIKSVIYWNVLRFLDFFFSSCEHSLYFARQVISEADIFTLNQMDISLIISHNSFLLFVNTRQLRWMVCHL